MKFEEAMRIYDRNEPHSAAIGAIVEQAGKVKITQEAIEAFGAAWRAECGRENVINCYEHNMGDCPYHNTPGARRRAGLTAALTALGFEVEE